MLLKSVFLALAIEKQLSPDWTTYVVHVSGRQLVIILISPELFIELT